MTLEEFVLEVMDRLETAQGLAGVEICRSGTAALRRCPPSSPLIAVGLGEMKFSQTAAGGDLGGLGTGREAEWEVSLSICVPASVTDGEAGCIGLFAAACGAFPPGGDLGIRSVSAQKAAYDADCGCFRLEGRLVVSAYLTEVEE